MKTTEKALAYAGLAVVLYALSVGPVWSVTHGFEKSHTAAQFYLPIFWLCLQSKPLNDAANWYLGQWFEFHQSD